MYDGMNLQNCECTIMRSIRIIAEWMKEHFVIINLVFEKEG